jgi:PAT family beta-lactamase induction signal transducer AmpG
MLLAGIMGFSSGLPILLSLTVLQAWLTAEGVDLATIGLLGLIALPYNLKFIWAPVIDRFDPLGLGRRKSWLAIAQVCVAISLLILGTRDPYQTMWAVAIAAILVAFFSATQDIVIDAYRRESVADDEQGLSASMSIYGYRFGTLLASAGGLILADRIGFSAVYIWMAAVVLSMVVVTLFAPEPEASLSRPGNLRAAFVAPFTELFQRHETARAALLILLFVFVYNLGMQLSGHMAIPFYLAVGFTNTEIGAVSAIFGVAPFLLGVLASGWLQLRLGAYRALILGSMLACGATLAYVVLIFVDVNVYWLSGTMGLQSLAMGVGTAALVAFISNTCNRQFTATQYALFTSLAALPRATLTTPTGWFAEELGWTIFFLCSASLAIPGLLLLVTNRKLFENTAAGVDIRPRTSAVLR